MLVIARKVGEALRIGRHITVIVHQIQGKRVQLSVEAPDSVRIARAELETVFPPEPGEDLTPGEEVSLVGETDGDQP